jgi:hypothetical protein
MNLTTNRSAGGARASCPPHFPMAEALEKQILVLKRVKSGGQDGLAPTVSRRAFTLIEVMVAVGLFFMAVFAILGVVTQGLGAARNLEIIAPHAGMLASELILTNQLHDGKEESGDFGKAYPQYTWERETVQARSNGLFEVVFHVYHRDKAGQRDEAAAMNVLMYKPESPQKGAVGEPPTFRSGGY